MAEISSPSATNRRDFLSRILGLSIAGIALAKSAPVAAKDIDTSSGTPPAKGYQDSGHVRAYYRTLHD